MFSTVILQSYILFKYSSQKMLNYRPYIYMRLLVYLFCMYYAVWFMLKTCSNGGPKSTPGYGTV